MTVAEVCVNTDPSIAPGLCRVRVWLLPADSPHHTEQRARTILRDVLGPLHIDGDAVADAEHVIAELAINAVQHAEPPCELRIMFLGEVWPAWCEVADSSPALDVVRRRLQGAVVTADDAMIPELAESGRGLQVAAGLSNGRCAVYPTAICQTGAIGKAIGFALPGTGAAAYSSPL